MQLSMRWWVLPALYVAIVLLWTWPAALQLTTHVIGAGGDPWQTIWRFENTQSRLIDALKQDSLIPFLNQEFFGAGEPRLVNLSVWPWLWLHVLAGQPLTYNLVWLASFVFSGIAMYALVRFFLRDTVLFNVPESTARLSAALAGLFYMLLPFHVAHALGHFGAMQTFWLPLLFLLLFTFLRRPRIATGLLFALVAALQTWTEHHYGLWFAIAALIVLVWHRKEVRQLRSSQNLPTTLVTVITAAALIFIPYWPTIREGFSLTSSLELGLEQTVRLSADPFAYVLPHAFHSVWGQAAATFFTGTGMKNVTETTHYAGLSLMLLLMFFHQRIPLVQKRLWGGLAGLFFLISLGPRLHVFGHLLPIPLPYALIDSLPVFDAVRSVGRAGVLVGLSLAVLLGFVAATQFKRAASFLLVATLILIEFISIPIPVQSTELSPAYDVLVGLPGRSVIEIPAATNYTAASRALVASLRHGKEIVGGIALERGQDSQQRMLTRSIPALRQVLYLGTETLNQNRPEFFNQNLVETFWDTLAWKDVAAVLIHTDSVNAQQLQSLRHFLEEEAQLQELTMDDVLVFPVAPVSQAHDGVFLWRREGWDSVVYDGTLQKTVVRISQPAIATVVNTRNTNVEIQVSFHLSTGNVEIMAARQNIPLTHTADGRQQASFTIAPGESKLDFVPSDEAAVLYDPQFSVILPEL